MVMVIPEEISYMAEKVKWVSIKDLYYSLTNINASIGHSIVMLLSAE